jgi:hypothetical protein
MRLPAFLLFAVVIAVSLVTSTSLLAGCGDETTSTTARAMTTTQAVTTTGAVTTTQVVTTTQAVTGPPTTPPVAEGPLEILSVDCNPPGDDNANLNGEYITFRVLVSGPLLGYAVEDESGNHYDFPGGTFLVGQTFRLHTGPGTDSETDLYWGSTAAVWDNGSDTITVLDPGGRVVISHLYFSPTTDD